ncbi:MAG TPA: head GIN domain-containing protein [Draconibacterium sp.]|jgi:hypothetical protein|nr:head GIN domain-containing protein [Draconibacterium sp.]
MKNRISFFAFLMFGFFLSSQVLAKEEVREVAPFSKISLKISANVYVLQDDNQSVRIVADSETLAEIITEVKDRTLNIRFPNNNIFKRWDPGKIDIYISVPEVDGLNVSGSGDIVSDEINTRILDLLVSGSGNIKIEKLAAEKVTANISGSGNIKISEGGIASDLSVRISGSGNVDARGFEAKNVSVQTSGSGNCHVVSNGEIKARLSGSGNVYYSGNPAIDSSVSGSGSVKER